MKQLHQTPEDNRTCVHIVSISALAAIKTIADECDK